MGQENIYGGSNIKWGLKKMDNLPEGEKMSFKGMIFPFPNSSNSYFSLMHLLVHIIGGCVWCLNIASSII